MKPLPLVLLLVVGALAGCSSADADPGGLPSCREAWGTTVDAARWDTGVCVEGAAGAVKWLALECADGRELRWNDGGFGYVGDAFMTHLLNLETGVTTFEAETERCLSGDPYR